MDDVLRDIQRLTQQGRELWAKLEVLEEHLRQQQGLTNRVSANEGALRQTREAVDGLQQQLAASQEQNARQALVRSAEADRDRRTLAELERQVAELHRLSEDGQSRVQVVREEARRDRATLAQLPGAIEDLSRREASLTGRMQQFEEHSKRVDSQLAAAEQRDEQVRAELARLDNWQRLADVRWNRQLGEWQEQAAAWKEQIEAQSKPIQQLTRQAARIQEDLQALLAQLSEQQKYMNEQAVVLQKLQGLLAVAREGWARLEQAFDAQRRRVDEQVAALFRLEERFERDVAELDELERRLAAQDARIEEVASLVQVTEAQRQRVEEGMAALQQQLRDLQGELSQDFSQLWEQLSANHRHATARLVELRQTHLQQRQRHLAAVQQEVVEWTGLAQSDGEQKSTGGTSARPDRSPMPGQGPQDVGRASEEWPGNSTDRL